MCIAILNKSNQLSRKTLKNCWDSNDDGAGFMYVKDKTLQIFHQPNLSPDDFNSLYLAYCTAYKHRDKDTPIVLHFRIATHGLTPEFLHPFAVSDTLGFVHNGILHGMGTHEYSDTAELRDLLADLPKVMTKSVAGLLNPRLMFSMLQHFIGKGNKLIFLDNLGDFEIINEAAGAWDNGNWFSNNSYKERGVRYYGSYAIRDYGKGVGSAYGKKDAKYYSDFDWDALDEKEWNDSFGTALLPASTQEFDSKLVEQTYHCSTCKAETPVNAYSECLECGEYNIKAESDVIARLYMD